MAQGVPLLNRRVVLPGGSGQVGSILATYFFLKGDDVTVLSRRAAEPERFPVPWRTLLWDGRTLDRSWTDTLESADAVIHLSGRSVNCRYTPANRREIIDSRVVPTALLGRAIAEAHTPPTVWMNASTATFYRHALDRGQDEWTGEPGGHERGVPETWRFSIEVARRWEEAFWRAETPATRRIALRTSIVMSPDPGGAFSTLLRLVRLGLGGAEGSGEQFVSWMHGEDFARAIDFLLAKHDVYGPVNLTAPSPLPNREFLRVLRAAWGVPFGLRATRPMLELGALLLRTETELLLKSRRVLPGVLLREGFRFNFPTWGEAAVDLVAQTRTRRH